MFSNRGLDSAACIAGARQIEMLSASSREPFERPPRADSKDSDGSNACTQMARQRSFTVGRWLPSRAQIRPAGRAKYMV
jgi:hypothetical protein